VKRILAQGSFVGVVLLLAACAGPTSAGSESPGSAAQPAVCSADAYAYGSSQTATFCSTDRNVAFEYPAAWTEVPDYGSPKFEGPTGYFILGAVRIEPSGTLEGTCDAIAHHQLEPFGTDPTIQMEQVAGQQACLILPSDDQADANDHMSELLVQYPDPFRYQDRYQCLTLVVDRAHIEQVVATLAFPNV
jgi:TolB protein